MSFKIDSKLLTIFQFYGVVTQKSCFSFIFATFQILFATATIWYSVASGVMSLAGFSNVSQRTHLTGLLILLVIRLLTLLFSAVNFENFHQIIEAFNSIDKLMNEQFKAEADVFRKKARKVLPKYCALTAAIVTLQMTTLCFLPREKWCTWVMVSVSLHINQMKEFSFIYFVDSINQRLESLLTAPRNQHVLNLHTELFEVSKLTNKVYGKSMTFHVALHSNGIVVNVYLAIVNLRFSKPIIESYRKNDNECAKTYFEIQEFFQSISSLFSRKSFWFTRVRRAKKRLKLPKRSALLLETTSLKIYLSFFITRLSSEDFFNSTTNFCFPWVNFKAYPVTFT